jgi:hypothetical protein
LKVTDGSQSVTLTISGNDNLSDFTPVTDNHGGTRIKFV